MKTIISLSVVLLVVELCVAKKEINFIRIVNCPEYKNNSGMYKNVVFRRNKAGIAITMSFDVVLKKEVKRLQLSVNAIKCDNSGNLDTCEFYMKDFKMNNFCEMAGMQNQVWSDVMNNSNFTGSCPVLAGTYSVRDTRLDGYLQLTMMTMPKALWKIKVFGFDAGNDNAMVYCSDMEINVFNSRRTSR